MEATKFCTKCNETYSVCEFHKNKSRKDGFSCWCRKCVNKYNVSKHGCKPKKTKARYGESSTANKAILAWNRQKRYGITDEEYKRLNMQQKGVCAICESPQSQGWSLCVDHDHKTGVVRGL